MLKIQQKRLIFQRFPNIFRYTNKNQRDVPSVQSDPFGRSWRPHMCPGCLPETLIDTAGAIQELTKRVPSFPKFPHILPRTVKMRQVTILRVNWTPGCSIWRHTRAPIRHPDIQMLENLIKTIGFSMLFKALTRYQTGP